MYSWRQQICTVQLHSLLSRIAKYHIPLENSQQKYSNSLMANAVLYGVKWKMGFFTSHPCICCTHLVPDVFFYPRQKGTGIYNDAIN